MLVSVELRLVSGKQRLIVLKSVFSLIPRRVPQWNQKLNGNYLKLLLLCFWILQHVFKINKAPVENESLS